MDLWEQHVEQAYFQSSDGEVEPVDGQVRP